MHRIKKLVSAGGDNSSKKSSSSGNFKTHHHDDSVSSNKDDLRSSDRSIRTNSKRSRRVVSRLFSSFRRQTSDSSLRRSKNKNQLVPKEPSDETTSRNSLYEGTSSRSTLSMSLASSGRYGAGPLTSPGAGTGDEGLSLPMARCSSSSFRASHISHAASQWPKNDTLPEAPCEESEHSSAEIILTVEKELTASFKALQLVDLQLAASSFDTDEEEAPPRTSLEAQQDEETSTTSCSGSAPETPVEPLPTTTTTPDYVLKCNADQPDLGYLLNPFTNMSEACESAEADSDKPLFAVFTESPGDEDLAEEIFMHPLIVEAIQTLFVVVVQPMAPQPVVRRAKSGRRCRAEIVFMEPCTQEALSEPLWGDQLTRKCIVQTMIQVLGKLKKHVPKYLQVLLEEQVEREQLMVWGTRDQSRGEVEMASIPGVVAAKSVFLNRQRVCAVTYDPQRVSYSTLLRHSLQQSLCDRVYHAGNEERVAAQIELSRVQDTSPPPAVLSFDVEDAKWEDDKSSKTALRSTPFRFVPLTGLQSITANRLIHQGFFHEAMRILSPWQGQILMKAMQNATLFHDLVNVPLQVAWQSVCEQKDPHVLLLEMNPVPEESDAGDSSFEDDEVDFQYGL